MVKEWTKVKAHIGELEEGIQGTALEHDDATLRLQQVATQLEELFSLTPPPSPGKTEVEREVGVHKARVEEREIARKEPLKALQKFFKKEVKISIPIQLYDADKDLACSATDPRFAEMATLRDKRRAEHKEDAALVQKQLFPYFMQHIDKLAKVPPDKLKQAIHDLSRGFMAFVASRMRVESWTYKDVKQMMEKEPALRTDPVMVKFVALVHAGKKWKGEKELSLTLSHKDRFVKLFKSHRPDENPFYSDDTYRALKNFLKFYAKH